MNPPSYAIILTHNRPELLSRCIAAIAPQVDTVLIIDNASDPPVRGNVAIREAWRPGVFLLDIPDQPPNLSRLWNTGFDWVADIAGTDTVRDVAVLCDDAIVPDGWFRLVADGMRQHGAAAASTHGITPCAFPILKTAPDSDIINRMPGWAWMVAGEKGLRADERLLWWYGDTQLDWSARVAGGTVILPGPVVPNERPNDFTVNIPELGAQAGRDREMFQEINGWVPW